MFYRQKSLNYLKGEKLANYSFSNKSNKTDDDISLIEGDISYRCISKQNNTCLVINNKSGNICENVSNLFENVYSIEKDKKNVLIQENKFRNKKIKNITVIESNYMVLPFKDEYFDLVIYNGLDLKNQSEIFRCFKEVKRVMKSSGCFCFGGKNKSGFGLSGRRMRRLEKQTYSESYENYMSIFNKLEFKTRSYLSIGSLTRPYFISDMDDMVLTKWIFSNIENFFVLNSKTKLMVSIVKKTKTSLKKFLIKMFIPSFLFYCYKNSIPYSFEDMIKEKTGYSKMIQQIRFNKVVFILFDDMGNPKKKLLCKRTKINLTDEIVSVGHPPSNEIFKENLLLEDWIEGSSPNFNNLEQVTRVLGWLLDFQLKTSEQIYDLQKINHETNRINENLHDIGNLNLNQINEWLSDYVNQTNKLKVKTTGVHGDFGPHNILINMDKASVNVIDWETFAKHGSPFYDIAKTVYHVLTPNSCVDEFVENVKNINNHKSIQVINKMLSEHFQNKINLIIILRYYFIKELAMNEKISKPYFIKLLQELAKIY
jgi:ubiquinone/menaquinone biosynthesis C-methylase UbiE